MHDVSNKSFPDMASRLALLLAAVAIFLASGLSAQEASNIPLRVPSGFVLHRAAAAPLVERPMFVTLAPDGALYVLDSGGVNGNDRGQKPPDVIRVLKDVDGDGVYDKSSIFADKIVFGTGMVWHDDALFVTSPPSLWKLEDTNHDGVADKRTELVSGFAFNQSCSDDLHGACLGPDGRIYFLPGRFAHRVTLPGGKVLREAFGPWLMRCRADGSDVEFVSGAVGNPVEVAFLPSGEPFVQGTFWAKPEAGDGLRDALVHIVEGGEYSVRDRDYSDRIRTGDFLPALVPLTATAPSGLTAYRGNFWGPEYQDNLFTSHFNTRRILRHQLTSGEASFQAATEDFVVGQHDDIHFTDVTQDADGSLLVVDTGGWFRACCPTSGTGKAHVFGAIYRVTKANAPKVADPYGNALPWQNVTTEALVARLGDARFHVQERTIEALRKLGEGAIAPLERALADKSAPVAQRLGAVWALCRTESVAARQAGQVALSDPTTDVRLAAAKVAGLHRDATAYDALLAMLKHDSAASVRREAASALGRLRNAQAIPGLLEAAETANPPEGAGAQPFAQHAIIYALIKIDQPQATRAGLRSNSPAIQRAALIALDQMPAGDLRATDVTALLSSTHRDVQQAAVEVLGRHPQWESESVQYLGKLLALPKLDEREAQTVAGAVRALGASKELRALIERELRAESKLSPEARQVLLRSIANSGLNKVPSAWRSGMGRALAAKEESVRLAALDAITALQVTDLHEPLHRLASDSAGTSALRLAAMRALVTTRQELNDDEFRYLLSRLANEIHFTDRLTALGVVAIGKHSSRRLQQLLPIVDHLGPVELPYLLAAFATSDDAAVGIKLVESLERSPVDLAPELVDQMLQRYPESVSKAAEPLLARLRKSVGEQTQRLDELQRKLAAHPGDAARGRALFFAKASCHLCHTAQGRGGEVGPNLSGIGAIRARRDLLEAIVLPSKSFARGYEPVVIELSNGRIISGMLGRESADEITINTVEASRPVEVRLRRADIGQMRLGQLSTMPQGLDGQLTPQELSDLVTYLEQLRPGQTK